MRMKLSTLDFRWGISVAAHHSFGDVMDYTLQIAVQDLGARYALAIDDDRLEEWPDFFTEKGRYIVTTAENHAQRLPAALIYATSRAMIRDRVKSLREANIYEGQRYRHVVGTPLIANVADGTLTSVSSFLVVRIMNTGESMLFATGVYLFAFSGWIATRHWRTARTSARPSSVPGTVRRFH